MKLQIKILSNFSVYSTPVQLINIKLPSPDYGKKFYPGKSIVIFYSLEKWDINFKKICDSISNILNNLVFQEYDSIIFFPFAHLSEFLQSPSLCLDFIDFLKNYFNSPRFSFCDFGYKKNFSFDESIDDYFYSINPISSTKFPQTESFSFYDSDTDQISPISLEKNYFVYQKLIDFEIKKNIFSTKTINQNLLSQYGIFPDEYSDKGMFSFMGIGKSFFDLVCFFVKDYFYKDLSMNLSFVKTPCILNSSIPEVNSHVASFNERLFNFKEENFLLRYAGCINHFSLIKKQNLGFKDLPYGIFEFASSFRKELSGELKSLYRLRAFTIPDNHTLCYLPNYFSTVKELYSKLSSFVNLFGFKYQYIVCFSSSSKYSLYINDIIKLIGSSFIIKIISSDQQYYWDFNIECFVVSENNIYELGTIQLDSGNPQKYGIVVKNIKSSAELCFLHFSLVGSIERFIFFLISESKTGLPLPVSPYFIVIICVSSFFLKKAQSYKSFFEQKKILCKINSSTASVSKKIIQFMRDPIPKYYMVIGSQEPEIVTENTPFKFTCKLNKNYYSLSELEYFLIN